MKRKNNQRNIPESTQAIVPFKGIRSKLFKGIRNFFQDKIKKEKTYGKEAKRSKGLSI